MSEESAFSVFYKDWFKQLATSWDLSGLMAFARVREIKTFIAKISPPSLFLFSIQLFHSYVGDTSILAELFVECFIHPWLNGRRTALLCFSLRC
jgi:hypothetical protein